MSKILRKRSRAEMIRYTRPTYDEYTDADGNTQVAAPNKMRFDYRPETDFVETLLLGIKFGDGDTAVIPPFVNELWRDETKGGTLVAMGNAPQGVTWLRCGNITITGVDTHKLHIIELTPTQVATMVDAIEIFPNAEDIDADCHLRTVKYYDDNVVFPGDDREAMEEFNTFLHGAWN